MKLPLPAAITRTVFSKKRTARSSLALTLAGQKEEYPGGTHY